MNGAEMNSLLHNTQISRGCLSSWAPMGTGAYVNRDVCLCLQSTKTSANTTSSKYDFLQSLNSRAAYSIIIMFQTIILINIWHG